MLPFFVPLKTPIDSLSYLFGFNNKIAVAGAIFSVFLFVLVNKIQKAREYSTNKDNKEPIFVKSGATIFRRQALTLWIFIILYVFLTIFCFFVFDNPNFHGEEEQFIKRIDLIGMGKIVYRDFWFPFGTALIYSPFFLQKAFHVFGVTSRMSYYILYALLNAFNLYILYYLTNRLNIDQKHRSFIFFAMAFLQINFSVAVQYTFTRILPAYFFLFLTHDYYFENYNTKSILKNLGLFFCPFFFLFIEFLLFMEIGMAFFLTVMIYLLTFAFLNKSRKVFLIFCSYLFCVLLFLLFLPSGFFQDMKDYLGGGNNFPIFPSPPVLIYVLSLFYCVPFLFQFNSAKNKNTLLINLSYAFLCVFLLPGAFGRSDTGHIFYYGAGIFLATAAIFSRRSHKLFKVCIWIFIFVYACALFASSFAVSAGKISASLYSKVGKHFFSEKEITKYSSIFGLDKNKVFRVINFEKTSGAIDYHRLDKYLPLAAPLAIDHQLYSYIKNSGKFIPEYFLYLINVDNEKELERKISDLTPGNYMIIGKEEIDNSVRQSEFLSIDKNLSMLFFFPVKNRPKNPPLEIGKKFIKYVKLKYNKIEEFGQYYILERKQTKR